MTNYFFQHMNKTLLSVLTVIFFSHCTSPHTPPVVTKEEEYVCLPCGNDCDSLVLNHTGTCEKCKMELVKKSTVTFSNIQPSALYSFVKAKGKSNVLLLDVRTPAEFAGTAEEKFGKLKGAINIPVQQLKERITELDAYKNRPIIVYCSHSHRSPAASYLLTQYGFTKVNNLLHGMHTWLQDVTDKESNDSLYIAQ